MIGQGVIERKLSALLGAKVTFQKFSVSLTGTIEAAGMRVGDDGANPLLTIVLIRATVSLKRALKGEIVVKSITIEKPVISAALDKLPRPAPTVAASASEEADDKTSWKLDVEKLFIIDGQ